MASSAASAEPRIWSPAPSRPLAVARSSTATYETFPLAFRISAASRMASAYRSALPAASNAVRISNRAPQPLHPAQFWPAVDRPTRYVGRLVAGKSPLDLARGRTHHSSVTQRASVRRHHRQCHAIVCDQERHLAVCTLRGPRRQEQRWWLRGRTAPELAHSSARTPSVSRSSWAKTAVIACIASPWAVDASGCRAPPAASPGHGPARRAGRSGRASGPAGRAWRVGEGRQGVEGRPAPGARRDPGIDVDADQLPAPLRTRRPDRLPLCRRAPSRQVNSVIVRRA